MLPLLAHSLSLFVSLYLSLSLSEPNYFYFLIFKTSPLKHNSSIILLACNRENKDTSYLEVNYTSDLKSHLT